MFEKTQYRLNRQLIATAVDDDEKARFPEDTELPAGTEFVILREKHDWPKPGDPPHYTIRMRGGRYVVDARDLEAAMKKVA